MALIKCPECSNQVSDMAESCPSCGMPMKQRKLPTRSTRRKASVILSIVAICLGTLGAVCSFIAPNPAMGIVGMIAALSGISALVRIFTASDST